MGKKNKKKNKKHKKNKAKLRAKSSWKDLSIEELRNIGDQAAEWAFNFMSTGFTRGQLAQEMDKPVEFIDMLCKSSTIFEDAIERAETINMNRDLLYLRSLMGNKDANAALVKLYFNEVYGINDRVPEQNATDKTPIVNINYSTRTEETDD